MKNTYENIQFQSIDSNFSDKKNYENKRVIIDGRALPSSKGEINLEKFNVQNTQSFNFSTYNRNSTTLNDYYNTSSLTLSTNENLLFENDFSLFMKPCKLGKTRNCVYINNRPIISFGKDILFPLLLILIMCLIYLIIWFSFFSLAGNLLKKLFNYFFALYIFSHLSCIFLNPGIPSFKYHQILKYNLKENKIDKFSCSKCKKCNLIYKLKDNVGHCKKCNLCYFGYDRHSFWSGHCIAQNNKLFYIGFILSFTTFIMLCLTMIIVKILKVFFIKET